MSRQRGGGRPSALKHGLTSQLARDEDAPEVKALATALLGSCPPSPRLTRAAIEAAEAIVHSDRIRQARRSLLDEMSKESTGDGIVGGRDMAEDLAKAWGADAEGFRYLKWRISLADPAEDGHAEERGLVALLDGIVRQHRSLERLADYERRALSRRRKALRRLDYERIEAQRRREGE